MAHELDQNRAGEPAFVSRVRTAWHRLGTVLSDDEMDALSLDELLERAGLDFEVAKAPNIARVDLGDGRVMEIAATDESYSIVRLDRMDVIGTVGATYKPLQNADAFRPIGKLVEDGTARLETAGSLRGGKQVWGLVAFDIEEIVRRAVDGSDLEAGTVESFADEVLPYGLFTNDHTGGARARMQETAVRVVCANTYAMAAEDDSATRVEVTHTGSVEENYEAAARLLVQSIASRYAEATCFRETLGRRRLTVPEFRSAVLDIAVPAKHLETKLREAGNADQSSRTELALTKAYARRTRIEELWRDGAGHTGDGSAWEAFQGYVQYVDHEADARDLGISLLSDGNLGRRKNRVAASLAALAEEDSE